MRTNALHRKQKVLDKRDKILAGEETTDELLTYDPKYHSAFTEVEQIAQNIVRLEDKRDPLLDSKDSDKEESETEEEDSQSNTYAQSVSGASKSRAPTPDNASSNSKMKFGSQKKSVAESRKKSVITTGSIKSSVQPNQQQRVNTQKEKSDRKSTIVSENKSEIQEKSAEASVKISIKQETASKRNGTVGSEGVSIADGKSIQPNTPNSEERKLEEEAKRWEHLVGTGGVSDYWAKAIENNPMIMMSCQEKDKPILQCISNIKVDKKCLNSNLIHVQLFFFENEYFTNEKLEFIAKLTEDEKRAFEIKGCDINWKEGKDVTKKIIEKRERVREKDKPGAKKEYKIIKQEIHDHDSIFNVFISKQAPDGYFEGP